MQSSDTLFNHLICCVGVSWQLLIITQLDVMDRGLHFCVVDSGLRQGGRGAEGQRRRQQDRGSGGQGGRCQGIRMQRRSCCHKDKKFK